MAMASSEAYEFTVEVQEIHDDLLMELLEETCVENAEVETDRGALCVDLCGSGPEQCCNSLDGVLSDLDSEQYCSGSPASDLSMSDWPFDWPEVDNGMMNGWYMDEDIEYGDQRDVCSGVYYGESCAEQVYIPLWQ